MANHLTELDLFNLTQRALGLGPINSSTYSVLRGISATNALIPVAHNTDQQGYVFFTKPGLNLSKDNLTGFRKMVYLANEDPYSMGNAIRCMLSANFFDDRSLARSSIVDDKCAFLPISNLLLRLSNPPDLVANTYTSSEGMGREQVSYVDDVPLIHNVYDLTATFLNMEGDPLTAIFNTWIEYAQCVSRGVMHPYPYFKIAREVDYQTCIYRLIMDKSKRYVQDIFACGAAFPTNVPIGAKFGYDRERPFITDANEIQINFRTIGAYYNDPALIHDFNTVVGMFNVDMSSDINRKATMTKVIGYEYGFNLQNLLSSRLYPFINPNTMELEWYAYTKDVDNIKSLISNLDPKNIKLQTTLLATGPNE